MLRTLIFLTLTGALSTALGQVPLPAHFQSNLIWLELNNEEVKLAFYMDTGGFNYLNPSGKKKLSYRKTKSDGTLYDSFDIGGLLEVNSCPASGIETMQFIRDKDPTSDGMLGREYFAEHVWTIDYQNEKIYARNHGNLPNEVDVQFKVDASGVKSHHLGRIQVEIGGEKYDMLLDTGAQLKLSAEAQNQLKKEYLTAGSFISDDVFQQWKKRHPE